jgi:hypothetical protein
MLVITAFVIGSVITGVFSQTDFELASIVSQVFSRQG